MSRHGAIRSDRTTGPRWKARSITRPVGRDSRCRAQAVTRGTFTSFWPTYGQVADTIVTLVTFNVAGFIESMSCARGVPLAAGGISEGGSAGLGVPGRAVLGWPLGLMPL